MTCLRVFLRRRWLPETPRWLMLKGRFREALRVLSWAASVNGRALPPAKVLLKDMEAIRNKVMGLLIYVYVCVYIHVCMYA